MSVKDITKEKGKLWLTVAGLTMLLPFSIFAGISPIDINLSLIGLIFVIYVFVEKKFGYFKDHWFAVAIIFWLYLVAISLAVAGHRNEAMSRALTWIRFPVFTLALQKLVFEEKKVRECFVRVVIGVLCLVVIDSFWQLFSGRDILGHPCLESGAIIRLTGPLTKLTLGFNVTLLMFPALLYVLEKILAKTAPIGWRVAGIIFIISCIAIVFVAGDRMPFLLTGLGCFIVMLVYYRRYKAKIVWMVLALTMAAALPMALNPKVINRQLVSTLDIISKFRSSKYYTPMAGGFEVFKTAPLLGVGPKNFRYVLKDEICSDIERQHPAEKQRLEPLCADINLHPHNIYVELLAETGLVGLLLVASIFFIIGVKLRRLQADNTGKVKDPILIGAIIAVIIRLWPLASSASFFEAWSVVHLWCMLGMILSFSIANQKSDRSGNEF